MGLIKQLFTNCACPQGRMGRPDEQGYACKSQDEFEGYDKDVLHNGNGFIS